MNFFILYFALLSKTYLRGSSNDYFSGYDMRYSSRGIRIQEIKQSLADLKKNDTYTYTHIQNDTFRFKELFYKANILNAIESRDSVSQKAAIVEEYQKRMGIHPDSIKALSITAGGLYDDWNNSL